MNSAWVKRMPLAKSTLTISVSAGATHLIRLPLPMYFSGHPPPVSER